MRLASSDWLALRNYNRNQIINTMSNPNKLAPTEGNMRSRIKDLERYNVGLAQESSDLQEALRDARQMLGDASRDEINLLDELEKWDRAYAHLFANPAD